MTEIRVFQSEDKVYVRGRGDIAVVKIAQEIALPKVGELVLLDGALVEIRGVEGFGWEFGRSEYVGLLYKAIEEGGG